VVKFSLLDLKQVLVASFVATLFFFVIRAGQPFTIDKNIGIIVTLFVIYLSNPRPHERNLDTFTIEIITTYIAVSILAIAFKLTDLNTVTFGLLNGTGFNLDVFGSAAIVAFWLALPLSVLYNKHNLDNFLSRIFIKRR